MTIYFFFCLFLDDTRQPYRQWSLSFEWRLTGLPSYLSLFQDCQNKIYLITLYVTQSFQFIYREAKWSTVWGDFLGWGKQVCGKIKLEMQNYFAKPHWKFHQPKEKSTGIHFAKRKITGLQVTSSGFTLLHEKQESTWNENLCFMWSSNKPN